ncbi:hypothetical protein D6D22_06495 [Aureobasidium pullulans]|uniref:Uncharacterized protein n=1 Tax=Aureobasidium pullulans TaxID=5580 RepID=A0A4S8XJX1_AURPU|nr:hypothetical protein D6D22_06495 [Aureobasidium pullulans]
MASQTASAVPEVAKLIDDMLKDEPELARAVDHSIIWRKLWLDGILRLKLDTAPKLTWIIDSLDECQADVALSKLLIHLCEKRFARILVTAKADHHTYHVVPRLVNSLDIRIEDTQEDISAYLDQQLDSSETRLRNGILAKSNGCFLWATLVVRRLENVHGLEARLQAIQSEPPGMQDLYANISKSLPDHQLSRTILTWVFCAVRPLSLAGGIAVYGLSATNWDECLCTLAPSDHHIERFTGSSSNTSSSSARRISETASQPGTLTSVASGKSIFAIGSSTGKISLFNDSTCLEEVVIRQDTRVKALKFATRTPVLISVSNRTIHAWNTQTSKPMWTAGIQKECMDLAFVDDERVLLVALQNNVLLTYNALDGTVLDTIEWARRLQGRYGDKFKSKFPLTATFKTELSTLAIVYRGQDIVLWNYEEDTYQLYNHDTGLSDGLTVQMASVNTLLFSRSPESSLLVASYTLADLVLFDVRLKKVKVTVSKAGAYYRLSASPDGRTFAAGASDGTIKLYDFETLRVVYTIRSEDHAITTLAFNHDSVRLFDIRGNGRSCRVWEPAALLRREIETESVRTPSTYSRDNHEDVIDRNDDNVSIVTALACQKEGRYIVGKNDATVWLFDSHSGKAVAQLFKLHASITKLGFHKEHSLLISVDTAGYLFVHRLQLERDEWCAKEVFQHQSMGTGVQHSIMNHKCDRILICANDKAAVYSIRSGQAFDGSIDHEPEVSYAFTNHPTNPNILISAHRQTIRLYSWQNLASVNVENVIDLSQDLESDMQLRGVAPILNNSALILNYSGHGPRVKPRAFSIPIPVTSPGFHETKVIAHQQAVCDQMEYYIGSYQDLEVFLGTDGWIYSVNKTSFKDKDEVLHHFMPPSDWVRANPRLVINVTDLGDILFAWKGEVAVVKHGLDKDYEMKRVADAL